MNIQNNFEDFFSLAMCESPDIDEAFKYSSIALDTVIVKNELLEK